MNPLHGQSGSDVERIIGDEIMARLTPTSSKKRPAYDAARAILNVLQEEGFRVVMEPLAEPRSELRRQAHVLGHCPICGQDLAS